MQKAILKLILFFIFAGMQFVSAQKTDTRTQIFNPNFKTLRVSVGGNFLFPPIITLYGDDRLIISFDELAEDVSYLRYSVVHCNADWQPSSLVEAEYLDGFNFGNVDDYDHSAATFAHYINYNIVLPNDNMKLQKSGNYLLRVYPEDDPDNILLQARFSVCESLVKVFPSVSSRTDIDYNSNSQQVSFEVNTENYDIRNLYSDLKAYVSQNSRYDNEVLVTNPLSVESGRAAFQHNKSLIFPAGNEYRRFETVATNYPGMGVERIEYHHPYYHMDLYPDVPRTEQPYSYDQTQYGRFVVRESNASNSDTGADYVVVHFALDIPQQYGGNIYIDGDLTDHIFSSNSLMKYNPATGRYENDMFLKQGSYNYQYLWVPDGSPTGFTSKIEGDKYQTVNEYLVKIYHRPQGERYDRFIGYGMVYSGR